MILLWFFLGIVIIFGIAKYNESNSLFWTLLLAFLLGFGGTAMVLKTIEHKKENTCFVDQNSTQGVVYMDEFITILPNETTLDVVTEQNLVGQGSDFLSKAVISCSKILKSIQDEPSIAYLLDKPPRFEFFDTS